jgi:hypothetical protein
VEGLAEHLSHHTWDGTTLRLGVVPLLSLEDRAGKALEAVSSPSFRLEDLVDGPAAPRPESMHLVRFLAAGGDPKRAQRFEDLSRKLDHGETNVGSLFGRLFGSPKGLLADWRAWLATAQEPWASVHVEWEARGPTAIRGRSAVVSACRTKKRASKVSARFVPPEGDWGAGVLLQHASVGDFTVGLVAPSRACRVDRLRDGAWQRFAAGTAGDPGPDGVWEVSAFRRGGKVVFVANGCEIGEYELPGDTLGLAIDHAAVDFTDVTWSE